MNLFGLSKKRQYTDLQIKFLDAMRDPDNEGSLRKCKEAAGYTPHVSLSSIINSLHEEIVTIAREMMCSNAALAAAAVIKGITDPDPMTPIKTQNAERILDRVGLGKGEKITVESGPSRIAILPARRIESE